MANLGGRKVAGGSPSRGKPPANPSCPRVGSGMGVDVLGSSAGRSGGLGRGSGADSSGSGGSSGRCRGLAGDLDLDGKGTDLVAGSAGVAAGSGGKIAGVSAGDSGTHSGADGRGVAEGYAKYPGVAAGYTGTPLASRSRAVSDEGDAGCARGLTEAFPVAGLGHNRVLRKSGGSGVGSGSGQGGSMGVGGAASADPGDTAASPRQQPASKVIESNRLFWEAKNERIWNRERGVGIKHYPELLGARKITISLDQWNKGLEKLENALVGIVFGEKPNLGHVRGFAKARWQDRVKVAMLNDGIFLFKFSSEELRSEVLFGGPLTFNHKPLVFQRWDPDVSYSISSVKSIPVWVRLPGLRAHFQEDEELLGMICSAIGKPLKTDGYTAKKEMMTFARACIEIYSDQEYLDRVTIEDPFGKDLIQEIEYEWIPKRCVNCCSFGHTKEECDMPSFETVESEEESDECSEDHCDPGDSLGEDKDTREGLEVMGGDSARISPDFPQDFLDIPRKSPDLPGKVQGSLGESAEDSESGEGEVIPDTQDTSPAPSESDELPDKALDDFERHEDRAGAVGKKKKKPKDKDKEKIEVLVRRDLRSARDKGGGSNVAPRRGRGRGKRR